LQERIEIALLDEPTYRVTFERDEGQAYGVGARVTVHPMNRLFRTIDPDPSTGEYLVMRCERVRDVGWKALRVSLHLVGPPDVDAAPLTDAPPYAMVADNRG
jgi:hypothetical protein